MFGNPLYKQLHTRIVRYIAPYDAAVRPYSLDKAKRWIRAAEAQHSRCWWPSTTPSTPPRSCPASPPTSTTSQKFVKLFPHVRQYQSWDEANRGNDPAASSRAPRRAAAARYYQALLRVCKGCTVIGLDVLDAANIAPTLQLHLGIQARDLPPADGHAEDLGPAQLLRRQPPAKAGARAKSCSALGGQVWLTETGGIVQVRRRLPEQARLRPARGRRRCSSTCSPSRPPNRRSSACTSTTGPAAPARPASTPG